MDDNGFIDIPVAELDGSWTERVACDWRKGNYGIPRVSYEDVHDPQLEECVNGILDSNGTYQKGDSAVFRLMGPATDMALMTVKVLEQRGIRTDIILQMTDRADQLKDLLERTYGLGSIEGLTPDNLRGLTNSYQRLMDRWDGNSKGHWLLSYVKGEDPTDLAAGSAVGLIGSAIGRATSGLLNKIRETGEVKSWDMWYYPVQADVDKLNDRLGEGTWTLPQWRETMFRAMAVQSTAVEEYALEQEDVQMLIEGSLTGKELRYISEGGSNYVLNVGGRPVLLDKTRIENWSLGGTKEFFLGITNVPGCGEVCTAPLENSVTGIMEFGVDLGTELGMVRGPYRIWVEKGQAVKVEAGDNDSQKVLEHYTGIKPFDQRLFSTPKQMEAFKAFGTVAEFALSGRFNPVYRELLLAGRILPCLDNTLVDEKVTEKHDAFGANTILDGTTPEQINGEGIEHTDFMDNSRGRLVWA
jgi:leucyl aminopeptidase (aminopeptidase T)